MSTKAPKSVIVLTVPSITSPTLSRLNSSRRISSWRSSSSSRRETTMFFLYQLTERILTSSCLLIRSSRFGTGRRSTCEPGRNASSPRISTASPPFTRLMTVAGTPSALSDFCLMVSQASWKSAFFLEMTGNPSRSSNDSRYTLTSRPSAASSRLRNSSTDSTPSAFKPMSTRTALVSRLTTRPVTMSPSRSRGNDSAYISAVVFGAGGASGAGVSGMTELTASDSGRLGAPSCLLSSTDIKTVLLSGISDNINDLAHHP